MARNKLTLGHDDAGYQGTTPREGRGADNGPGSPALTPKVVLVSGIALHRDELGRLLEKSDRVQLTGKAGPDQSAIVSIRRECPDVVLLDLPAAGALRFARFLSDSVTGVRLLALGVREEE